MTIFQASDPENRDKVLSNLYSSTKRAKRSKPKFKVGAVSEYAGINAHSKKAISLNGLRKYL